MVRISPSLLAADFLHLDKAVEIVNSYADFFHLDVMDGVFVPNISIGFPVMEAIASEAKKPLDAHLMVVNPEKYALRTAEIPLMGMVSFHLEACPQPAALLENIRKKGVSAGLVVNPDFKIEKLFPFLKYCDFVLIMSVFAGFGGQKFIETTPSRVSMVKNEILRQGLDVKIEVDGGVNSSNSASLIESGADILVAGTSVFKAADPASAIEQLRQGRRA